MPAHSQAIFNHVDEDPVRRFTRGRGNCWRVSRHYAKHFKLRFQKQVNDGPLIVDFISNVCREANWQTPDCFGTE
jgi:hypothetical protein